MLSQLSETVLSSFTMLSANCDASGATSVPRVTGSVWEDALKFMATRPLPEVSASGALAHAARASAAAIAMSRLFFIVVFLRFF